MVAEEVSFASSDGICRGVLFRPQGSDDGPLPAIVLAHGMSGTRLTQYDRRARRLVESGVTVLDFDPRFVGTSPGEPRQLIDPYNWLEDLRSAVAYVRGRPDVVPEAVGLYGSSLGGGLVIAVAADDSQIAAIAVDVPGVDGVRMTPSPIRQRPALVAAIARDVLGRRRGRAPVRLPVFGGIGSGAVVQHDVEGFWRAMKELDGVEWVEPQRFARHAETGEWRNEATAAELLHTLRFRPIRRLARVQCPVLAHLSEDDGVVPYRPTRRALAQMPAVELRTLRGGHFAPFYGDGFEATVRSQVEFFRRHLAETA